jgi:hypothetical protein
LKEIFMISPKRRELEQWNALLQHLHTMAKDTSTPAGIKAVVAEGIRLLERKLAADQDR